MNQKICKVRNMNLKKMYTVSRWDQLETKNAIVKLLIDNLK